MCRPSAVVLTLILAAVCAPARGQTPADQFELARSAFEYQDYDKVKKLLTPLLEPEPILPSSEMVLKAREMLGAALWWSGNKIGFKAQLTELLMAQPAFELDSFYYPPEMVQDFKDLKQRLVEMKIIQVSTSRHSGEVVLERTFATENFAVNFLPFGIPQYSRGRPGMGTVFLSGQAVGLGVNIASWAWMYAAEPRGQDRNTGLVAMYAGLAVFSAFYVWGVIDAVVGWQPQRLMEEKRVEKPEDSASIWHVLPGPIGAHGAGLTIGTFF